MSESNPGVIPMIAYENGPAAMDWLVGAFGFRERERRVEDGRLTHGELDTGGGGVVMLATPSLHYHGPKHHREECATAMAWHDVPYIIDGFLVYIDDAAAHFERAKAAGATILSPLEGSSEGGRRYRAEDLEGHRWMFMER